MGSNTHLRLLSMFLVLALANVAQSQDVTQAEIVLTNGDSGLPRDGIFYSDEKVFATVRIESLSDPRPYVGQIQVTASIVDAKGNEVLRVEKEPETYWQVLGGDTIETTLAIDSNRKNISPGNYTLRASAWHVRSNRRYQVRHDFAWKIADTFCGTAQGWYLDRNLEYPSGPLLQPGRFYAARCDIMNMSVNDRMINLQAKRELFRPGEQSSLGGTVTGTILVPVPKVGELPKRFWESPLLQLNRIGDLLISSSYLDLPSGRKMTLLFPAKVAGTEMTEVDDNLGTKPFILLSQGAFGKVKRDSYLVGEDIWVTLGFADAGHKDLSQQVVHAYLLDGNQQVVKEIATTDMTTTGFLSDSAEFPLSNISNGEMSVINGFPAPFFIENLKIRGSSLAGGGLENVREIQFYLEQKETGKETILSTPIRFRQIDKLSALNIRISADPTGKVPAGKFLTAGRTYYLKSDISKYAIKDYAINVTHAVKAFTEDGKPIEGTELVLEHEKELSVSEKLEGKHPLSMQISLNRPGKFILRWTFTDNLSGETFTTDLPVEVVSPFQFVRPDGQ